MHSTDPFVKNFVNDEEPLKQIKTRKEIVERENVEQDGKIVSFMAKRVQHEPCQFDVKYLDVTLFNRWKVYVRKRDAIEEKRNFKFRTKRDDSGFTDFQKKLMLNPMTNYENLGFVDENLKNATQIREIHVLHIMNHIFRGINERKESKQGFFRPKILLLFPTRILALRFMKLFLELLPEKALVKQKDRFLEEFCNPYYNIISKKDITNQNINDLKNASTSFDETDFANFTHPLIQMSKFNHKGQKLDKSKRKSIDYLNMFETNIDHMIIPKLKHLEELKRGIDGEDQEPIREVNFDDFKIGIKVKNKKSLRLYSEFTQSDIILASASSLVDKFEADNEDLIELEVDNDLDVDKDLLDGFKDKKHKANTDLDEKPKENFDFLSSIEICMVFRLDIFMMQNLELLKQVLMCKNKRPVKFNKDIDFSNLRTLYVEKEDYDSFCQLSFTSSINNPIIISFARNNIQNSIHGYNYISRKSYTPNLTSNIHHTFLRIGTTTNTSKFVFENLLPKYLDFQSDLTITGLVLVFSKYSTFLEMKQILTKIADDIGRAYSTEPLKQIRRLREKRKREYFEQTGQKLKKQHQISSLDPTILNQKKLGDAYVGLFADLSELSHHGKTQKIRWDFQNKRFRILMVTERFMFYGDHHINEISDVIFCGLPIRKETYHRMAGLCPNGKIKSVYDTTESHSLQRLVGTKQAKVMLKPNAKKRYTFTC